MEEGGIKTLQNEVMNNELKDLDANESVQKAFKQESLKDQQLLTLFLLRLSAFLYAL